MVKRYNLDTTASRSVAVAILVVVCSYSVSLLADDWPAFVPARSASQQNFLSGGDQAYPVTPLPAVESYPTPAQTAEKSFAWQKSKSCDCDHGYCNVCTRMRIGVDYMYFSRSEIGSRGPLVVGGPDGFRAGDGLDLGEQSGWRLWASANVLDWQVEGIFTDLGKWDATRTGTLTGGVSFDQGFTSGGPWLGLNYIDGSTLFAPIMAAHSGATEIDEFEGFGSGNTVFLGDIPPTFEQSYRSEMESAELNFLPRCYVRGWCHGGWRVGVGYAHTELDESLTVGLAGTYRAVAALGLPNGGVLDFSLSGAGLNLINGLPNGFSDGSGNHPTDGNPFIADTLVFTQTAITTNELNGFQLIYDALLFENKRVSVSSRMTGGIHRNRASGTLSERYSDEDSTYGRDFNSTASNVAFTGSVNAIGKYWVCDWLAVSGGYELIFVSGVALATDQVAAGSDYIVDTDGDVLTHGLRLGLEGRY